MGNQFWKIALLALVLLVHVSMAVEFFEGTPRPGHIENRQADIYNIAVDNSYKKASRKPYEARINYEKQPNRPKDGIEFVGDLPISDHLERLEILAREMQNDDQSKRCYRYFSLIDDTEKAWSTNQIKKYAKIELPNDSVYQMSDSLRLKTNRLIRESKLKVNNRYKSRSDWLQKIRHELTDCLNEEDNILARLQRLACWKSKETPKA